MDGQTRRPGRGRGIAAAASIFGLVCAVIAFSHGPGLAYALAAVVFAAVVSVIVMTTRPSAGPPGRPQR